MHQRLSLADVAYVADFANTVLPYTVEGNLTEVYTDVRFIKRNVLLVCTWPSKWYIKLCNIQTKIVRRWKFYPKGISGSNR